MKLEVDLRKERKQNSEILNTLLFYKRLLENKITEDDILNHAESIDVQKDFYAILDQVVDDDEREKIEFYSKLFREFFRKKLHLDFKKLLTKTFKELTRSDFDELIKIYTLNKQIKSEATSPPGKYFERAESKLYRLYESLDKDTLLNVAIQNLKKLGILTQNSGEPQPKPAPLLDIIGDIIS